MFLTLHEEEHIPPPPRPVNCNTFFETIVSCALNFHTHIYTFIDFLGVLLTQEPHPFMTALRDFFLKNGN